MDYRKNAKENDEMGQDRETKVWRGALYQTLLRCLVVLTVFFGGGLGYAIVHWVRTPEPTPVVRCHDEADIIRYDSRERRCAEGATIETTRIRRDNMTDVLVVCRCSRGDVDAGDP